MAEWLTGGLLGWLSVGWRAYWSIDPLDSWVTDWLTGWLSYCMSEWVSDWLIDWSTEWLTDCLTGWVSYRLIDRLNDSLTHSVTRLLTDCLTGSLTHEKLYIKTAPTVLKFDAQRMRVCIDLRRSHDRNTSERWCNVTSQVHVQNIKLSYIRGRWGGEGWGSTS